ncbi:MAG TPA: ABC transporter permease [Polyangiaceae bacterium]|jgi:lipoprotein-releasing system permease protein|nr:ABC transporter permease [Polyangiaceae bacterium]
MRTVLFVALRQLWDRKLLNGIAVLGVALGVLVLIGINGIMQGFQQKFLSNILKISPHVTLFDKQLRPAPSILARFTEAFVAARVSHQTPSDRPLRISRPTEVVRAIERMEGVGAAAPSLVGSAVLAIGAKQYSVDLRGIDPLRQDRVTPISGYIQEGSYRALHIASDGILLGSGVASRIGAKVDDVVVVGTPVGERLNLRVVGIFEAGIPPVDAVRVYVTLENAQTILGKPDVVGRIEVRLLDPETGPVVAERLERALGYDAESWQETNANFLSLFKQQNTIISFVVSAILAVGGFGILAIQIMIVLQKTRDIAILRSVGFRRFDILTMFLLQGGIIALIGGAIGNIGGHYLLGFLGSLKTKQEGLVKSDTFLVYDDPRFYYYGVAFALCVGLLASLIPALRASRVEPVDVLRGQLG